MPELQGSGNSSHKLSGVFGPEQETAEGYKPFQPEPAVDSPIGYVDFDGIYHSPMASCQTVICTLILVVTSAAWLLSHLIH